MIAALYVQTGGAYFGLPNVDPWDEARDARTYAGPWSVVAHPPCARWCRLAKNIAARGGKKVGDDDGCFASALACVRRWGGVLEHPAWSLAWPFHGLMTPFSKGWAKTTEGEWVCEVSQAAYGHRAGKLTWLLYVGETPPTPLNWSRPPPTACVSTHTRRSDGTRRRSATKPGELVRMNGKESSATPPNSETL